ncbi:ergosterol biosynthesis ERG4/ERG24 [Chiua virens]|nr:ergosterol biosynthesis ERG4/ERG24 [Chiua virens]
MGPPGATLITIGVPVMAYLLYFGCSESAGACPPSYVLSPSLLAARVQESVTNPQWWISLWDTQAALIYLAWYAFCIGAWVVLPGDWIKGVTTRDGQNKQYKINAFSTFLLALGITTGYIVRYGPESFTFMYDKWLGFLTASLVMSIVQAIAVYVASFRAGALLALGGNSGNPIYDFYIGRELNPSIGSFDIKSFNELRPGLILWVLIDISMVCKQAVMRGGWENVTWSMWLVLAFQSFYVVDALYNEPSSQPWISPLMALASCSPLAILPGCLLYTPSRHVTLSFKPVELDVASTLGIVAVNALGYWIFRDANGEKNDFRNGKNPKSGPIMDDHGKGI